MGSRVQLQTLLESILGSKNVYFQPPPGFQMKYPAIVYERDAGDAQFGDNNPYIYMDRYLITSIDANPDSLTPRKIAMLPMCTSNRHFTNANLNHDVYILYF